jgi:hypothetical protein
VTKIAGSGSISRRHESADPHRNVMDPEHWFKDRFSFTVGGGHGRVHVHSEQPGRRHHHQHHTQRPRESALRQAHARP